MNPDELTSDEIRRQIEDAIEALIAHLDDLDGDPDLEPDDDDEDEHEAGDDLFAV